WRDPSSRSWLSSPFKAPNHMGSPGRCAGDLARDSAGYRTEHPTWVAPERNAPLDLGSGEGTLKVREMKIDLSRRARQAVNPGLAHAQIAVQQDEIGAIARREAAKLAFESEEGGGHAARHGKRPLQGLAEDLHRVPDGRRHVEIGAGEHALLRRQPSL